MAGVFSGDTIARKRSTPSSSAWAVLWGLSRRVLELLSNLREPRAAVGGDGAELRGRWVTVGRQGVRRVDETGDPAAGRATCPLDVVAW
jgi:hypothetical protein